MSRILLDTSVLVDAESATVDLDDLIGDDDEPALAAITAAELGVGIDIATGKRKARRRAFLDELTATLPIVPYDLDIAHAHRDLLVAVRRSGRPRGAHDLIIAATARATGRLVVTTDLGGFEDLPQVEVRTV